jgi:hypothetical protein
VLQWWHQKYRTGAVQSNFFRICDLIDEPVDLVIVLTWECYS